MILAIFYPEVARMRRFSTEKSYGLDCSWILSR